MIDSPSLFFFLVLILILLVCASGMYWLQRKAFRDELAEMAKLAEELKGKM